MKGFFESLIGLFVVVGLTASGTLAIYHTMQAHRELHDTQIKFEAYQDGVKDSQ